ncbi:hypothetical protein Tco_1019397 [Tanacetum coccineum]|uniref:Transposase n=1 Tax=Tanacetum coccineum TaxID=301880 RepID=A0ABQ5FYX1_9ASTR
MYVSGRVDIFDMIDIDLFTVVALNMMVLKLGYTGKSKPMFYNYLKPLTSLDEGLYDLPCEEDVRCLGTLVRSFKLIEVYIEHGVTALDSYLKAPRETTKEPVCESVTPSSLPQHDSSTHCKDSVCFTDVAGGGVDSSGLSHDESFGVDNMDLNLNEPVNLNVSQVETQSKLPVSEEPDVGRTQEPILSEEFSVEDVVVEDYVSSGEDKEDAEQGNGQEDESAPTDGWFFYDDERIDTAYETEYDVQYSEDAGTDDDDVDEYFLVDEDNEIVEPDVDVHLFGISMDLPFDNIGITNLVSDDVLEGEDVDVINADGFDNVPCNDEEKNYRKRRLAELRTKLEGVINASGQWKYSFYTGQKFTTPKEAKDRVYLHSIESRRNLKLHKNDGVRIRVRCDEKVHVFIMSQGKSNTALTNSYLRRYLNKSRLIWISQLRQFKTSFNVSWRDYVIELQSTNPNTIVKIAVERNTDPSLPTRVFQRIYICLGALKLGFRARRRYLLGLDGAFMKESFLGQCLGDDIDLHPNSNFTFISDRQKGIIPAIKTVYPSAEHKYCLRHLHENIKQGWCRQAYKDLLWRAASATNVKDFEKCMLELKTINPKAHAWLNKIPAEHWARSYFSGVIDKCTSPLTPSATRIMESIKKEAHLMKVQWNGANKYQVLGLLGDQCVVDVVSMTCSCRKWELTGIPCGNNAKASGSASGQAQQTEPAVGQDGSGGSGAGAVIGLSTAAGEGGAGVASQGSSRSRWTKRRVQT